MSVTSVGFLVATLIGASFFHFLPNHSLRRGALAAANAFVLWLVLPNLESGLVLLAFLGSGFAAARWLARRPGAAGLTAYLVVLISAFVVLKRYAILPEALLFDSPVQIVGLSYMLFRQIHFIVDTMQGTIEDPDAFSYANYQLNFLALLAGPIQRYQDFASYFRSPEPLLRDRYAVLSSVIRVLLGIFKVGFIGAICLEQYEAAFARLQHAANGEFPMAPLFGLRNYTAMLYLYPAYVYFNFSGYCDVVIGTAALFGLKLPENFRQPWLARNMIDFWTRQHITLGFWIRDYVFTPMYKAAAIRYGNRASSFAFACYFVAFFLAGVWHGSTLNFVIFGLIHGAGVSVTKAWENYLVGRIGRKGLRVYLNRADVRAIAIAITLHYVAFSFMFFTPDTREWWRVTRALASVLLGLGG